MSTEYYTHGTYPIYGSQSSPTLDGAEWDKVMAGFAKLPVLSTNPYKITYINAAGTAITADTATTDGAGTWALTGIAVSGSATVPTMAAGDSTTHAASTAFVAASFAPLASPTFTGTVTIPSGASISGFAPLASPALTGSPTAPTAVAGTNTTQIATTAFATALAFAAALPAQLGGTQQYQLNSIGGVASWGAPPVGSTLYLANNFGAF